MYNMKNNRMWFDIKPFFTIILLFTISCSDIFDNVREFANSETIYADKLDGIIKIQVGYERVEIDLMKVGRIPSRQIKMGRAKKTVIECEDFEEDNKRRVIYSVCSWVNITGLTKLKTYKFKIYTEDEYGNRSLPLTAEARPFTKENLDALELVPPVIVESSTAALVEWRDRISTKIYTVYDYSYQYTDKDGVIHSGGEKGDLPSVLVENIQKGIDIPLEFTCKTIPNISNLDGSYTPILDSVDWKSRVILRISENAQPAIFLKTPKAALTVDVNNTASVFPLTFSWTKVGEVNNYLLKFSEDSSFPDAGTTIISVGSVDEYVMNKTTGLSIINSFPKARLKDLYWTVVPASHSGVITTQTRKIIMSRRPVLIGKWKFDEGDYTKASIGQDLISIGSGFANVSGPTNDDGAVKVNQGSFYKCIHGMSTATSSYTVMFYLRFPNAATHSLMQTNPNNTDAAELMINSGGYTGVDGIGYATNPFVVGNKQWHRVFMTVNNGMHKIFINGELAYSGVSNNSRHQLDPNEMLFFADAFGNDNDIEVAEIALWDFALEDSEMLEYDGLQRINKSELNIADFSNAVANCPATNLIDGRLTNNPWAGDSDINWITVDLGKQRNLGRVVLFTSTWGGANPKTVQLFVGNSAAATGTWNLVGDVERETVSVTPGGGVLLFEFNDQSVVGRFVKVYLPDRYGIMVPLLESVFYEKVD